MKLLILALVVALATVLISHFLCPMVSILVIAIGLWLAFECFGVSHWFVGLHPESVRIHYNRVWAQS